jgi:amino acid adenylation domain-containing protein
MCLIISFNEDMSADRLKEATQLFIQNNPDIRIRLHLENGECMQYYADYEAEDIDMVAYTGSEAKTQAEEYYYNNYCRSYELYDTKLYFFAVVKINHEVKLYIKIHHIITDGWTMALIMNNVINNYNMLLEGKKNLEQKEPEGKYIKYSQWEQDYLVSEQCRRHAQYWQNKFKAIPMDLNIEPYKDFDREDYRTARAYFTMDTDLTVNINRFCKSYHTSAFRVMLAAIYIYIHKVTCREDIIISTYSHNRSTWKKNAIGMFVSTLPMRISINSQMHFLTILDTIREEFMMCMKNQNYPFDQIVNDIRTNLHEDDVSFLNDILVSFQNATYPQEVESSKWYFNGNISNKINFHISDRGDKGIFEFEIDYRTALFQESDISRIFSCIKNLIQEGIRNPKHSIKQLDMLGEKHRVQLLCDFNATKADLETSQVIHKKFEAQVNKSPNHPAIYFKGKTLTYSQLNNRSNQLAWVLRDVGVKNGVVVAVLIERSEEMVMAILAILKAGGGYLPLDPSYPDSRIHYIIEDSGAEIILTKERWNNWCFFGKKVLIDNLTTPADSIANLPQVSSSNDLAYLIYTSGSTGKPKGVMIEHRAAINFMQGMLCCIDFNEKKTILALTTISFDISFLELILPLTIGMRIVIADEAEQMEPLRLSRLITEQKVDMLQMTPSRMQLVLANQNSALSLKGIKEILLGGEAVTADIIKNLRLHTDAKLYNMYGPTETTIWSTVKEIKEPDLITIGKPIANTTIYIMNKNLELVPIGVIGEICIAGAGVARGYHKRETLNQEKFVKIPTECHQADDCDAVMYRTGDLGCWMANGEIRFVGRVDTQVKLRGYRIELGEIEKVFMEYEGIQQCAVVVTENKSKYQSLVLYYSAEKELLSKGMDHFLKEKLPDYMIPSHYIWLKELPMTLNGKLDKKFLPYLSIEADDEYEIPNTAFEIQISDIWNEIFEGKVNDKKASFFDIGGNSFNLIMMHSKLEQCYPGKVEIADIFAHPSIQKLASFIEKKVAKITEKDAVQVTVLPPKYFSDLEKEQESLCQQMNPDPRLQQRIYEKCRAYEIDLDHFMLAMYLYFLAEISATENVFVWIWNDKKKKFRQINMDFADILSLPMLFHQVKAVQESSANAIEYSPKEMEDCCCNRQKYSILPLFMFNVSCQSEVPSKFDFILEIEARQERIAFTMEIKHEKISPKTRQALANGYLEMLDAGIKQI